jgi:hypothetical protein
VAAFSRIVRQFVRPRRGTADVHRDFRTARTDHDRPGGLALDDRGRDAELAHRFGRNRAAAGLFALEIAFDQRHIPAGSGEITGSHGSAYICTDHQHAIH